MTSNFRAMTNRIRGIYPRKGFLNGKSTTIQGGEPVILVTDAALTTASNPVLRSVVADDIADFADSPVIGFMGFALHDAVTDSSGFAGTQNVYASKASAAEPRRVIPSYGAGQPMDPNISYSTMMVALAYPGTIFRGKLKSGTASNLLLGLAGLDLTAGVYTVDPSATTKIFSVVGWDPSNTAYVYFEVISTYCQILSMNIGSS
jgi:hypothetical protein